MNHPVTLIESMFHMMSRIGLITHREYISLTNDRSSFYVTAEMNAITQKVPIRK